VNESLVEYDFPLLVQLLEPDGSSVTGGGQAVDDSVVVALCVPVHHTAVADLR
jgi:hypothetical protein